MRGLRGWRPSAPLVISLLALFVALGGGAYAVSVKLKPNSVKTKNLKNGAVKTQKLADGAVTGEKIATGAIDRSKLGADARAAVKLGTAGQILSSVGGVVGSSKVNTGVYCVDLSFTPVAGVGSIDPTGGGQGAKDVQVAVPVDPSTGCPASSDAEIDVTNNNLYSSADATVYVIFM